MTPAEKQKLTWQRKREREEETKRERNAIRAALMRVINNENATPAETTEAARLLIEFDRPSYDRFT